MKKLATSTTLRVVLLPLVGIFGTIFVLTFPSYHTAFCAGVRLLT